MRRPAAAQKSAGAVIVPVGPAAAAAGEGGGVVVGRKQGFKDVNLELFNTSVRYLYAPAKSLFCVVKKPGGAVKNLCTLLHAAVTAEKVWGRACT